MARKLVSSGSSFEADIGYSRAVVDGDWIFVSGTTGFDYGTMTISDDIVVQCQQAMRNIESALGRLGARLADVVRTRLYVTDIGRWQEVGRAHGEVFGAIRPASTMVEVARLIDPAMLVEIEAEAYTTQAEDAVP